MSSWNLVRSWILWMKTSILWLLNGNKYSFQLYQRTHTTPVFPWSRTWTWYITDNWDLMLLYFIITEQRLHMIQIQISLYWYQGPTGVFVMVVNITPISHSTSDHVMIPSIWCIDPTDIYKGEICVFSWFGGRRWKSPALGRNSWRSPPRLIVLLLPATHSKADLHLAGCPALPLPASSCWECTATTDSSTHAPVI